MGKALIIAEKPNVASQLLQSPRFRNIKRKQGSKPYYGYFENDQYIVTWARGHLYEVLNPGDHDEKYKDFLFEQLPIILPVKYKPIEDSKEQINIINHLLNRDDVDTVINACDTDKEGELIFREIYELASCSKPIYRIWLSSYELGEVEAAFNRLLIGSDFDGLADSARARQLLDHLIGDTITRASTVKFANKRFLLAGGRVQICLLNEIRKREIEVEQFKPKNFYNLFTDTGFLAQYQTEQEYILNPTPLKEIGQRLKGKEIVVKDTKNKQTKRNAPNLFNATDFLKAAIQKLSISAPQAKSILQKLYEGGYVSYPRSDSRHLPASMVGAVQNVVDTLQGTNSYEELGNRVNSASITEKHRCFDDEKVTSHYAIIPTKKPLPEDKPDMEKKVYDLIVKRFLSNFMDPATFDNREITLEDREGNLFIAKEKVLTHKGFMEIETVEMNEDEPISATFTLPNVSVGQSLLVNDFVIKAGTTRNPGYHTEPSILSFMETAGRNLVEDEEIRELLKGKRIGTAATAESFIPKLLQRGYIYEEKGKLKTTSLGAAFIDGFPNEDLKNPTFTAEMEENITKIEQKVLSYEGFTNEIIKFAHVLVDQMKVVPESTVQKIQNARNQDITVCNCSCKSGKILDKGNFYGCGNFPACEVRLPKVIKGKNMPGKQIQKLIEDGETDLIKGFKDDEGNSFEAIIVFAEGKLKFRKAIYGTCPKCKKGEIKKNKSNDKEFYGCSLYKDGCAFSIPGTIKGKKLPEGQIKKLLQQRSTDFINGFLSKNDTEFTARIALTEDGGIQMLLPTEEDKTIGQCPLCRSRVLIGKSYYLCENYKKSCDFILSPVFGKKQIPIKQVAKLLDKNLTDTIKGFENKDGTKKFDAKLSYNTNEKRIVYVFEQKKKGNSGRKVTTK